MRKRAEKGHSQKDEPRGGDTLLAVFTSRHYMAHLSDEYFPTGRSRVPAMNVLPLCGIHASLNF